jgi:hypothetical protein
MPSPVPGWGVVVRQSFLLGRFLSYKALGEVFVNVVLVCRRCGAGEVLFVLRAGKSGGTNHPSPTAEGDELGRWGLSGNREEEG